MRDYKPNSYKSKEDQNTSLAENKKKVEKVISGTAKTRKKSPGAKFAEVFLAEDVSNVKSYIFNDVIVPTIQKLITDIVTDSMNILFRGRSYKKENSSNPVNYVSYRSIGSQNSQNDRFAESNSRTKNGYSFDSVELETRGECERVLSVMGDLIDTYGMVSVADMYEMVGITPRFTDYDYGWRVIGDAKVERSKDGFILVMPNITPLKK